MVAGLTCMPASVSSQQFWRSRVAFLSYLTTSQHDRPVVTLSIGQVIEEYDGNKKNKNTKTAGGVGVGQFSGYISVTLKCPAAG